MRGRGLCRRLLAQPPRLLFREAQLKAAIEKLARKDSVRIEGPPGVGKTTLARMAAASLGRVTYVAGFACRTYNCLRARIDFSALNIIDDYGLILRDNSVVKLVESIPWKVVVTHPGLYARELDSLPSVHMPPYTFQEIRQILLERVQRLSLTVDAGVIDECAREAAEHSGSIRLALLLLYERVT